MAAAPRPALAGGGLAAMNCTHAVRTHSLAARFTKFHSKRHELHSIIASGTNEEKIIRTKIDSKPHE